MKKLNQWLLLNTVRKKVFLLSKLIGGIILLFYVFTAELPTNRYFAFLVWFILLIAVICGADFLLDRFISKPLNEINQAANQMAKLDFSSPCSIHSQDEFGELSHNLNVMSDNLQEALKKLESANGQLEKDVARERLMQSQRKELVDSLSHEMKTPLSLIRAYTEGLKDEKDELKRQKYMDIILSSTDRMNAMIVSLLDLSALESGAAKLEEERFDLIELVETVAGRLLLDTPDTNYHFSYELPEEKTFIYADKSRIEQVLNNLILNAINHICANGKLHLSVISRDNKVKFSIYNQGIPIPAQDLPKIWLKFYRGKHPENPIPNSSGLGLSIVAQILSMYESDYGVQNLADGVSFYFDFPVI